MTHARRTSRRRTRPSTREGAAMIVVMLVLLGATATAAFAVHSTSYELAAAGFAKQAIQADYAAEAGLHAVFAYLNGAGDASFIEALPESGSCGAEPNLPASQNPANSDQRPGRVVQLLTFTGGTGMGAAPLDRDALGGARQVYVPNFFVCIYDSQGMQQLTAGTQAGGGSGGASQKVPRRVTLTAYSSMELDLDGDDEPTDDVATGESFTLDSTSSWDRDYHEVSTGARAHMMTDPY